MKDSEYPSLARYAREMYVCTQCGYCKSVCPTFSGRSRDTQAARSRMMLCYGLLHGEIEPDDSVVEATVNSLATTFHNLTLGAGKTHKFTASQAVTIKGKFRSDGTEASKAVLRFSVRHSRALSESQRRLALQRLGGRLCGDGDLVIHASRHREQARNVEDARERLATTLREALSPPKHRRKTRPTRASVRRRLDQKRQRGDRKRERRERHD